MRVIEGDTQHQHHLHFCDAKTAHMWNTDIGSLLRNTLTTQSWDNPPCVHGVRKGSAFYEVVCSQSVQQSRLCTYRGLLNQTSEEAVCRLDISTVPTSCDRTKNRPLVHQMRHNRSKRGRRHGEETWCLPRGTTHKLCSFSSDPWDERFETKTPCLFKSHSMPWRLCHFISANQPSSSLQVRAAFTSPPPK